MEVLTQYTVLLIGIIGWAATSGLISNASQINAWPRRMLIMFTWLLWTVPAFDVMVYQGWLNAEKAVFYGTTLTIALALVISLAGMQSHRKS
jgi:uncharacterized membrane protein